MKKVLVSLVSTVAVIGAANAVNLRQYASLKASDGIAGQFKMEETGARSEKYDTKNFYGLSLAYGVKLYDFRAELEANWNPQIKLKSLDGVKENDMSVFVNAYYDIKTNSLFTPYIGLGVGYDIMNIKGGGIDDDAGAIGFRGMVGVEWRITNMFSLDTGYRFSYLGDHSFDGFDASAYAHEVTVGARVSF